MKVRNSFVSNSSSSSFVFNEDNEYKTTLDIAKAMVPLRDWDNDEELIQKLMDMGDYDLPIAFRSCNYDTYIAREGKTFYIFTCNNHQFYDILPHDYYEEDWKLEMDIRENNYFYWPEYNIETRAISYDEIIANGGLKSYCDKCYMTFQRNKEGIIICPKCKKTLHEDKA